MRKEDVISIVSTPSRRLYKPRRAPLKVETRKSTTPKKKRPTRGKLVKKLDAVFSQFQLRSRMNKDGLVPCYTCGALKPIGGRTGIQNGHYISRSVYTLRWSEDNTRPQCIQCNIFNHGQVVNFRENLVKELGELQVRFIEELRHQLFKPTNEWLLQQIEMYKERLSTYL